jgi:hypothetical protein
MQFFRYFYFLFGVLLVAGPVQAQPNNKKDKIEAQKVAFITQKLALTTAEAQAFWPLYNEYQQKRDNLRAEQKQLRKDIKENFEGLSDKEIETMIDQDLDYKQKDLDLAKDFNKKMKTVLPMKKVAMYYKAVEQFNKILFEETNKLGPGPKGKN